jgi:hypothetical protein
VNYVLCFAYIIPKVPDLSKKTGANAVREVKEKRSEFKRRRNEGEREGEGEEVKRKRKGKKNVLCMIEH